MNTIYFIGGSPRSGKTTIFNKVINQKPMIAISSDALREGIRNIFLDESYVSLRALSFEGDATFHRPGEDSGTSHDKHFLKNDTEDELSWKAVVGVVNHYERKNIPLIVEGIAVTPERVAKLQLKNLTVRAVFVGFTSDDYLETMLEHARNNNDWIHKAIQENKGDDSVIRTWFSAQLEKNKQTAKEAAENGYTFISVNNDSFERYCQEGADYLLKN